VRNRYYAKVVAIEERRRNDMDGWWVTLDNHLTLFVGDEKPLVEVGQTIRMTLEVET